MIQKAEWVKALAALGGKEVSTEIISLLIQNIQRESFDSGAIYMRIAISSYIHVQAQKRPDDKQIKDLLEGLAKNLSGDYADYTVPVSSLAGRP